MRCASIWLDVGVLDHLFPHAELNLYKSPQFLRRAGKSLEAHVFELRQDVWVIDDVAQCVVEFRHDRRRRSSRRNETSPSIEIEAFYSSLVHGRQVRIERAPLYA